MAKKGKWSYKCIKSVTTVVQGNRSKNLGLKPTNNTRFTVGRFCMTFKREYMSILSVAYRT